MAQAERTGIFRAIEALIGCILGVTANAVLAVLVVLASYAGIGPGCALLWEAWHNGPPTIASCADGCSLSLCLWPGRFCVHSPALTGLTAMLVLYSATAVALTALSSFFYTIAVTAADVMTQGVKQPGNRSDPSDCSSSFRTVLLSWLDCIGRSAAKGLSSGLVTMLVMMFLFLLLLFLLIPWRWKQIFADVDELRNHRFMGTFFNSSAPMLLLTFLFTSFVHFLQDFCWAAYWAVFCLFVFSVLDILIVLGALVFPAVPLSLAVYTSYGLCSGALDMHVHSFTTKIDAFLATPLLASSPYLSMPLRVAMGLLGLTSAFSVFPFVLAWLKEARSVFAEYKCNANEENESYSQLDGNPNLSPMRRKVDVLCKSMAVGYTASAKFMQAWATILSFFALILSFVAMWRVPAAVDAFRSDSWSAFRSLGLALVDYACFASCAAMLLGPITGTAATVDFFVLHIHWSGWDSACFRAGDRFGSELLGHTLSVVGKGVGLAALAATVYMLVKLVKEVRVEFADWGQVGWKHPLRASSRAFVEYITIFAGNVTALLCMATPVLVIDAMSDFGLYVLAVTSAAAAMIGLIRMVARLLSCGDRGDMPLSQFGALAIIDGSMAWAVLWPFVALLMLPFRFEALVLRHSHIWPHIRTTVHEVMPNRFQWKTLGVTTATTGYLFEYGLNWVDLWVGDVVFVVIAMCLIKSLVLYAGQMTSTIRQICRGDAPRLTVCVLDDFVTFSIQSVLFVRDSFEAIFDMSVLCAAVPVVMTVWRAPLMFKELYESKGHFRAVVLLQFVKMLRDFLFLPFVVLSFPGVPVLIVALSHGVMKDNFVGSAVSAVPQTIAYFCAVALSISTCWGLKRGWKAMRQRIRGWPLSTQELLQVSSAELKFTADGRGFLHLTGRKATAFDVATKAEVHLLGRRAGPKGATDDVTLLWDDPAWDELGMHAVKNAMRLLLPFQLTNTMIDLQYLAGQAVGDKVDFDLHLGATSHLLHRDVILQHIKALDEKTVAMLQVQVEVRGTDSVLCSLAVTLGDFRVALEQKAAVPLGEVAAFSGSSGVKEALQRRSEAASDPESTIDAAKDLRTICAEGEANLASWQDAVWRICLLRAAAILVDVWHFVLVIFVSLVPWCATDLCRLFLLPDKFWPIRRFMSTLESFRPHEDLANRIEEFHALAKTVRSVCVKNELALTSDSVREEKLQEASDVGKTPETIKTYRRAVSALQSFEDYRYAVRTVRAVYMYNDLTPWISLDAFEVLIHVLQAEYELQFATQVALHIWIAPARDESKKNIVELATLASEQLCEQLATRSLQEMFNTVLEKQKHLQHELDQAASNGCSWAYFFQKDSATTKQMIREAAITAATELAMIPAVLSLLLTGYRAKVMCKQIRAAHSASWRRKIVYSQFLALCADVVSVLELFLSTVVIVITCTEPTDFLMSCIDVMADNRRFRGHRLVKLVKVSRKKLGILWRWCKRAIRHLWETAEALYEAGWAAYRNMLYMLCVAAGFPPICLELILSRLSPHAGTDDVAAAGVSLFLTVGIFAFALFAVPHQAAGAAWFFEEEVVLLIGLFVLTVVNFAAMLRDPKTHRHEGDQILSADIPFSVENVLAIVSSITDAAQLWGLPFTLVVGMAGRVKDALPSSSDGQAEVEAEPAWWQEKLDAWRETSLGVVLNAAPALNFRAHFGFSFFYFSVWGSVAMVVIWLLVASIPYSLEKSLKAVPPGTFAHRRWWILMSKTLSSTAFMPIVNNLLKSFDCVKLQDGESVIEDMTDIGCWDDQGITWRSQVTMTHVCLLALSAYITTCTALSQEFVQSSTQSLRITSSPLYESSGRLKGLLVAFMLHLNYPSADAGFTTMLLCLCLLLGVALSVWTAKYETFVLRAGGAAHPPCSVPELTSLRVGGFVGFAWFSFVALFVLHTPKSSTWAAWLFLAGGAGIIAGTLVSIARRRRNLAAQHRVWAAEVLTKLAARLETALRDVPALPTNVEGGALPEGLTMCSFDDLHTASAAGSVRNFCTALLDLEECLEAKVLPGRFLRQLGRWRALLQSLRLAGNILEEVGEKDVEGGHNQDQSVPVVLDETDLAALVQAFPAAGIQEHDDPDPALVGDEIFLPSRSQGECEIRPNTVVRRGLMLVEPQVPPHGSFRDMWGKLQSSSGPRQRSFIFRRRWAVLEDCVNDLCSAAVAGFRPGDASAFANFLHDRVASNSKDLVSVRDALYSCLAAAGPRSLAEMELQATDEDAAPAPFHKVTPDDVAQELLEKIRKTMSPSSGSEPKEKLNSGDMSVAHTWSSKLQTEGVRHQKQADEMKNVIVALRTQQGSLRTKKTGFPWTWGNTDCCLSVCKFTAGRNTRVNFFAVSGCEVGQDRSRGPKYFYVLVPGESRMSFCAPDGAGCSEWVSDLNAHIAAADKYRLLPEGAQRLVDTEFPFLLQQAASSPANSSKVPLVAAGSG